jgi:hypothetical protein
MGTRIAHARAAVDYLEPVIPGTFDDPMQPAR